MALASEFRKFVDNDCSRRHVDAKGKGFCGEDDSNETFYKALLDRLLEWRNKSCVMARDSSFEGIEPTSVIENLQVVVAEFLYVRLGNLSNSLAFI